MVDHQWLGVVIGPLAATLSWMEECFWAMYHWRCLLDPSDHSSPLFFWVNPHPVTYLSYLYFLPCQEGNASQEGKVSQEGIKETSSKEGIKETSS